MKEQHCLALFAAGLLLASDTALAAVHYVNAGGTNATPPYTNWSTAATNIQDAVDAAVAGDEVVVTNGTYARGVSIGEPLNVRSVNGPQFTVIDGGGRRECASLTNGSSLYGFTLTNGVGGLGGGVNGGDYSGPIWPTGGTLSNCTLINNWANGGGGGAYNCRLNNCTLIGNSSDNGGGGACLCTLNNCTLRGNSSQYGYGAGAQFCQLNNCALICNAVFQGSGGGASDCTLINCTLTGNSVRGDCTTFEPPAGGGAFNSWAVNCIFMGNSAINLQPGSYCAVDGGASQCTLNYCIFYSNSSGEYGSAADHVWIADPLFVNTNGWADLRLQSDSPCINAGNNADVVGTTDLDSNPRIAGGTVDIGAYEFQAPTSVISYAWLEQYGLPTDGSADFTDPDGDGMNNWQEWRCGTDPTSALSALRLLKPVNTGTNVMVTWQSVYGVNYFLERSASLSSAFTPLGTNITGQAGTTTYTDTNAVGSGPVFYRVVAGN
jgi:hypothetical protein